MNEMRDAAAVRSAGGVVRRWGAPVVGLAAGLAVEALTRGLAPVFPVAGEGQGLVPPAALAVAGACGLVSGVVFGRIEGTVARLLPAMVAAGLAVSQSGVLAKYGVGWAPWGAMAGVLAGAAVACLGGGRGPAPERCLTGRLSRESLARVRAAGPGVLEPVEREAAVVTCRLLNETALRGRLAAAAFLKLNAAFAMRAGEVLRSRGGLVDEPEPGTVRGIFGLPLAVDVPADAAAGAAIAVDDALRDFADDSTATAGEPLAWGVGVASGTLTAGLGASGYTAAGDALERSKWLAQLNGEYHTRILTDDATHRAATRSEDRPLEILPPPDGAAVAVHQLLAETGGLSAEALARRDAFRDAVLLLRAGHAGDALNRFADARSGLTVPDPVLERFISQAEIHAERESAVPARKSKARQRPRNASRS